MLETGLIKKHLRLPDDFDDEDELLETYSNAARRIIENKTGRTIYSTQTELDKSGDIDGLLLDDDLTSAMLLYIGHLYENREASTVGVTTTATPLAFIDLIEPYRHFHFD